jgi:hypothetical protein
MAGGILNPRMGLHRTIALRSTNGRFSSTNASPIVSHAIAVRPITCATPDAGERRSEVIIANEDPVIHRAISTGSWLLMMSVSRVV